MKSVGIILLMLSVVGLAKAQTPSQTHTDAITELRNKTTVPIRFPTRFPGADTDSLYMTVVSADADGYEIVLGVDPGCEGGNACRYGTLIGTTLPYRRIEGLKDKHATPLTLSGGVKGYFYNAKCTVFCTDSYVAWSDGRFHYVVGLKAGKRAGVVDMANSSMAGAILPRVAP
jgi:hypothetical protein